MKEQNEQQGNDELDQVMVIPTTTQGQQLFSRSPKKAMEEMKELVQIMAIQCTGPEFISDIEGKQYPKVEWWTTLGATLGLFPVVIYSRKLDRDNEIAYESRVEVRHGERVVAAGEALCSDKEAYWEEADEYSIKSMSITRATGKAYRIPLSFIAVMSGLAPTNAEEVPIDGKSFSGGSSGDERPATPRQIDYIGHLCDQRYDTDSKRRMGLHLAIAYGKHELEELTKEEASELIDHLLADRDLLTPEGTDEA